MRHLRCMFNYNYKLIDLMKTLRTEFLSLNTEETDRKKCGNGSMNIADIISSIAPTSFCPMAKSILNTFHRMKNYWQNGLPSKAVSEYFCSAEKCAESAF